MVTTGKRCTVVAVLLGAVYGTYRQQCAPWRRAITHLRRERLRLSKVGGIVRYPPEITQTWT